jgi:hypothetical protein
VTGVQSAPLASGTNSVVTATATCAAGKVLLSGGFSLASADDHSAVTDSHIGTGESWTVSLIRTQNGGNSTKITAYAICVA